VGAVPSRWVAELDEYSQVSGHLGRSWDPRWLSGARVAMAAMAAKAERAARASPQASRVGKVEELELGLVGETAVQVETVEMAAQVGTVGVEEPVVGLAVAQVSAG